MNKNRPPELDMTLDGEFVSRPKAPVANRILLWAVIIAIATGALSVAAFALWLALLILPVALGAAVIAWAMLQYRAWRMQKSFSGQRNVWRP